MNGYEVSKTWYVVVWLLLIINAVTLIAKKHQLRTLCTEMWQSGYSWTDESWHVCYDKIKVSR